jgi:chromate transporter
VPLVAALFTGVQAAVIAIVIEALIRVSKRALKTREAYLIAVAAFLRAFHLQAAVSLVILAAADLGLPAHQGRRARWTCPRPARSPGAVAAGGGGLGRSGSCPSPR